MRFSCFVLILSFACGFASADPVSGEKGAFINKNCVQCHDADEKRGGFDIAALKTDFANRDDFAKWVTVFDRIASGEMPPRKKSRVAGADARLFWTYCGKT